jgi:hypothetical protein
MKKKFLLLVVICILVLTVPSCKFSLNGASTVGLKTIDVGYFENDAPLVVATLSQDFTEALKSRIRSTTNLSIVRTEEGADAVMTGTITGYSVAPVSISATSNNTAPIAGASALTITVQVKYTNNVNKKDSYEQSFSESQNFTGDVASQQNTLLPALIKSLTEDIFNKAFANW